MSSEVFGILQTVARGEFLSVAEAESFTVALMSGAVTSVQAAGVFAAMAARGEQVSEIIGFTRAMRSRCNAVVVPFPVLDTCGTGGDGACTFNVSTAVAIVCAAAGVKVAKHGNRAISSRAGSADVLEALGAKTDLTEPDALTCLHLTNLCFLFAPIYHPALRHAADARKQLGFRTIFNIVGPLTNPVGARNQIIGVFRLNLVNHVAETLARLGTEHSLVVHGEDGLDEISISSPTNVAEIKNDKINAYTITPEQFGLTRGKLTDITGGDATQNATIISGILTGNSGPCRDIVVLNAGAALYAANQTATIAEGVRLAEQTIDSHAAIAKLHHFIQITNSFGRTKAVSE